MACRSRAAIEPRSGQTRTPSRSAAGFRDRDSEYALVPSAGLVVKVGDQLPKRTDPGAVLGRDGCAKLSLNGPHECYRVHGGNAGIGESAVKTWLVVQCKVCANQCSQAAFCCGHFSGVFVNRCERKIRPSEQKSTRAQCSTPFVSTKQRVDPVYASFYAKSSRYTVWPRPVRAAKERWVAKSGGACANSFRSKSAQRKRAWIRDGSHAGYCPQ